MPDIKLEGKDLTEMHDALKKDIRDIVSSMRTGVARIFNGSGQTVVFYVYNYIDTVYWVSAQHTMVASGKAGDVSASGDRYKVHPNDNHKAEFLVEPGKVYLYRGEGDVEQIN